VCCVELAGSTKELHRQLDDIKVRRDKLNSARVQEVLLQEEAKRPGMFMGAVSERHIFPHVLILFVWYR